MKIFTLDNEYSVVCNWAKTRQGFKHIATLMRNGLEVGETKECYLNRTWESFEYETILCKLVRKFFTKEVEQQKYLKIVNTLG
jgi:hypothetical protein